MPLVPVDPWPPADPTDFRSALESGGILFFPTTPFELPESDKEALRNLSFSGGAVHKNIAYRPASARLTGIAADPALSERLGAIFRTYSRNVVQFVSGLLPTYSAAWKLDYASFRPLEEEGRDLPLNKRNDLIHVDAFPSRPTNGDLILRVFSNVSPAKPRVWVTSDPLAEIAPRYAPTAGLGKIATRAASPTGRALHRAATLLHSLGLPVVPRSAYDRFMLHFHDFLKQHSAFQQTEALHRFEFPPGATWLCFTDLVPHSVQSGQHALEQTFIVSRRSLAEPSRAPIAILERLSGRPLATSA